GPAWRLPGGGSAWGWPTATRSRHWGGHWGSTGSPARFRPCAPTVTPSLEPSLTGGWFLPGSPGSSRWPRCGYCATGPCPARADGDDGDRRPGGQARGRALVRGPRRRGSAGRRAVARRARTASLPRRGGDWRRHGLPRPARGGPAPRRPLPARRYLGTSPPIAGPG